MTVLPTERGITQQPGHDLAGRAHHPLELMTCLRVPPSAACLGRSDNAPRRFFG